MPPSPGCGAPTRGPTLTLHHVGSALGAEEPPRRRRGRRRRGAALRARRAARGAQTRGARAPMLIAPHQCAGAPARQLVEIAVPLPAPQDRHGFLAQRRARRRHRAAPRARRSPASVFTFAAIQHLLQHAACRLLAPRSRPILAAKSAHASFGHVAPARTAYANDGSFMAPGDLARDTAVTKLAVAPGWYTAELAECLGLPHAVGRRADDGRDARHAAGARRSGAAAAVGEHPLLLAGAGGPARGAGRGAAPRRRRGAGARAAVVDHHAGARAWR